MYMKSRSTLNCVYEIAWRGGSVWQVKILLRSLSLEQHEFQSQQCYTHVSGNVEKNWLDSWCGSDGALLLPSPSQCHKVTLVCVQVQVFGRGQTALSSKLLTTNESKKNKKGSTQISDLNETWLGDEWKKPGEMFRSCCKEANARLHLFAQMQKFSITST